MEFQNCPSPNLFIQPQISQAAQDYIADHSRTNNTAKCCNWKIATVKQLTRHQIVQQRQQIMPF